jgi:hypothetical protein
LYPIIILKITMPIPRKNNREQHLRLIFLL